MDLIQKEFKLELRKLDTLSKAIAAANSGHVNVFEDLLKEAFARTGKRREELMKSYLETAAPHSEELPSPSCKFPTYPPAVAALLMSPEAYPGRGRPGISELQSIPPNTLITNTWSDLPLDSQPLAPPKSAHMGMLHQARQINHRQWLCDRWLAGLIGPPLSAPKELEECLPPQLVKLSHSMLSEMDKQVNHLGSPGVPRFSPTAKQKIQSKNKNPSTIKPLPPPILRIPNQITPSHPLTPSTNHLKLDPLDEILPKRQRFHGSSPTSPLDLSRGPRRITQRFIRRRYEKIMGEIPILSNNDKNNTNNHGDDDQKFNHSNKSRSSSRVSPDKRKKTELIQDSSDGKFVDRNWITPDFDKSGHSKNFLVSRAGPGLGTFKALEISDEDSAWMP